jgi:hypothetical protein
MSGDRARHVLEQTVAKVDRFVDRVCDGDPLVQIGVMLAVCVIIMSLVLVLAHVLLWIGRV